MSLATQVLSVELGKRTGGRGGWAHSFPRKVLLWDYLHISPDNIVLFSSALVLDVSNSTQASGFIIVDMAKSLSVNM